MTPRNDQPYDVAMDNLRALIDAVNPLPLHSAACDLCRAPLQPLHGHLACHTSGCPLFGQNVAPCCQP
jgi:hypothetical protein